MIIFAFSGGHEIGVEHSSVEYRVLEEVALTKDKLVKTFFEFGLQWQVGFDISIISNTIAAGWRNIMDIRKFVSFLLFESIAQFLSWNFWNAFAGFHIFSWINP